MSISKKPFDFESWRNVRIEEAEANRDARKDAAADGMVDDIKQPVIDFYGSLADDPWSDEFKQFEMNSNGESEGAEFVDDGEGLGECPQQVPLETRVRVEIENMHFVLRQVTRLIAEVRMAIGERQSIPDEIPTVVLNLPWIGQKIAQTMETFARWMNKDEITELEAVLRSLQILSSDINTSITNEGKMTASPSPSLPKKLLGECTGYLKRYCDLRKHIEPLVPIQDPEFGV